MKEINKNIIFGSIIGDVIGSPYEFNPIKTKMFKMFNPFCRFTDDTLLTVATMDILNKVIEEKIELNEQNIIKIYKEYANKYSLKYNIGFGPRFLKWLMSENNEPSDSFGNGSAMRIAPIGWYAKTEEEVIELCNLFTRISHNSTEGIKGAIVTALAIFYAKNGMTKKEIKEHITNFSKYDLNKKLNDIVENYHFDATCQGSVPESLISFFESESFEDAIRNTIWLGGDADTMACIVGGIAEAYYGVDDIPQAIKDFVWDRIEPFHDVILIFSNNILTNDTPKEKM